MLDSSFNNIEIEDESFFFISCLLKCLIIESEKLVRLKFKLHQSNCSRKKTIDGYLKEESITTLNLEDMNLSTYSVITIIETKRHNIYCISTPDRLRAIKTFAEHNPTAEDIQNIKNKLKVCC